MRPSMGLSEGVATRGWRHSLTPLSERHNTNQTGLSFYSVVPGRTESLRSVGGGDSDRHSLDREMS